MLSLAVVGVAVLALATDRTWAAAPGAISLDSFTFDKVSPASTQPIPSAQLLWLT
jgi:hypothetical protein